MSEAHSHHSVKKFREGLVESKPNTGTCSYDPSKYKNKKIYSPPSGSNKSYCESKDEEIYCTSQSLYGCTWSDGDSTDPTPSSKYTDIFTTAKSMSNDNSFNQKWGSVCLRGSDKENEIDYNNIYIDNDIGCAAFNSMAACAAGEVNVQDGKWYKCKFDPQQCGDRPGFGTFQVTPIQHSFQDVSDVPDGACMHFGDSAGHSSIKGSINGTPMIAQASADGPISSWSGSIYTPPNDNMKLKITNNNLYNIRGAKVYTVQESISAGFPTNKNDSMGYSPLNYVLPAPGKGSDGKQWWCKKVNL